MFICGSGSFGHHDEMEIEGCNNSPCSTPKRSRRSTSFCKIMSRDNGNKNPYADRGLDKFYALLADLDDKKQKIYTEKGNEDISFVRFVYTNESDNAKPIVVKVKERHPDKKMIVQPSFKNKNKNSVADSPEKTKIDPTPTATSDDPKEEVKRGTDQKVKRRRCLVRSCSLNGSFKLKDFKQPQFYFAVMVVMILLLLAIYGRSFAILCTSIVWYLAPTITGESSSSLSSERKPKRKKEYTKKPSERKVVDSAAPSSPKSVINGLNDNRVQEHGRKRSW